MVRSVLLALIVPGKDRVASIVLPIELKAGYNDIRMANAYSWAPDIDCFTLTKE